MANYLRGDHMALLSQRMQRRMATGFLLFVALLILSLAAIVQSAHAATCFEPLMMNNNHTKPTPPPTTTQPVVVQKSDNNQDALWTVAGVLLVGTVFYIANTSQDCQKKKLDNTTLYLGLQPIMLNSHPVPAIRLNIPIR